MSVYSVNPLIDSRWPEFLERHPAATVFHTASWLEAIRRTYGYRPIVYTTTPPSSPLANGIVVCEVKSWITGRRLVSVPFSDHCQPLLDSSESTAELLAFLQSKVREEKWRYLELRTIHPVVAEEGASSCPHFHLHMLDLSPSPESLFKALHKDCIQRKVRRAERENLTYQRGNSASLLDEFYALMLQTRRKHQLPPQPKEWFSNLGETMRDALNVHIASKDGAPVASILTLQFKNTLVYKYGASDEGAQNLGGTPFLFWKVISEAHEMGMTCLDLGRSDEDNPGLVTFKNRLGAAASKIQYQRLVLEDAPVAPRRSHSLGLAKRLFGVMPDPLLRIAGSLLYRHVG